MLPDWPLQALQKQRWEAKNPPCSRTKTTHHAAGPHAQAWAQPAGSRLAHTQSIEAGTERGGKHAHLGEQRGDQVGGHVAVGEHRAAVHDARAQALVRGEAVLLDERGGLVAQRAARHAQEVEGDGRDRQLDRPGVGLADVVVVRHLARHPRAIRRSLCLAI
jgi:hypothetical protein